jgi:signal transduction histidine kinase
MAQQHATQPGFTEILLNGEAYRLYTTILDGQHIEVAQPVDVRDDQAEAAALAALLPMLLLMPLLGIVIAFVIRTLLQPVRNLAAAVSQRDIFAKESLPSQGLPKEVMPLVEEINRLLVRQNAAAARERHFVEDAAHALRTPLAALQLQADVLDGSPDPAERSARLADLRAGIQRASRLVDQLLSRPRLNRSSTTGSTGGCRCHAARGARPVCAVASAAQVFLEITGRAHAAIKCAPRYLILICSNRWTMPCVTARPAGGGAARDEQRRGKHRSRSGTRDPGWLNRSCGVC